MTSSSFSDNNVFNSNSEEDIYNKVNLLIRLPDREFGIVCASNKYYNDLCNNSFYSERIFEERTRRLVDNDIIEFKEPNMTWKDFYIRLFSFLPIQKQLIANGFEEEYTEVIFEKLIQENKLMELKIIKSLYDKINQNNNIFDDLYQYDDITYFMSFSIKKNKFEILKWLIENNENRLNIRILYELIQHNEMFKYFYDYFDKIITNYNLQKIIETLAKENNIDLLNFVDLQGVSQEIYQYINLSHLIYSKANLDTVKWFSSKGTILTSQAANEAFQKQNLPMVQWIYEQGVEPTNEIRN